MLNMMILHDADAYVLEKREKDPNLISRKMWINVKHVMRSGRGEIAVR